MKKGLAIFALGFVALLVLVIGFGNSPGARDDNKKITSKAELDDVMYRTFISECEKRTGASFTDVRGAKFDDVFSCVVAYKAKWEEKRKKGDLDSLYQKVH
jgi:hypothetical protein